MPGFSAGSTSTLLNTNYPPSAKSRAALSSLKPTAALDHIRASQGNLMRLYPGADLLHIRQRKVQEREDEARRSQSWRVMELFIISLTHSRRRTCTDP